MIVAEGPDTVAAFFAEPVMGAGGVIVPPATYFEKIQAVLKKHDVLLVADEVICGFGRTGEMWGSQTYGITPDILTCAKALTSGYIPIAAVMVNRRVFDAIAPQTEEIGTFGHGFTYSADHLGHRDRDDVRPVRRRAGRYRRLARWRRPHRKLTLFPESGRGKSAQTSPKRGESRS